MSNKFLIKLIIYPRHAKASWMRKEAADLCCSNFASNANPFSQSRFPVPLLACAIAIAIVVIFILLQEVWETVKKGKIWTFIFIPVWQSWVMEKNKVEEFYYFLSKHLKKLFLEQFPIINFLKSIIFFPSVEIRFEDWANFNSLFLDEKGKF